jgi:hypothetical protein
MGEALTFHTTMRALRKKVAIIPASGFDAQCLRGALIEVIEAILLESGDNRFQEESASFYAPTQPQPQQSSASVVHLGHTEMQRVSEKPSVQIFEVAPTIESGHARPPENLAGLGPQIGPKGEPPLIVDMQKDSPLIGDVEDEAPGKLFGKKNQRGQRPTQ